MKKLVLGLFIQVLGLTAFVGLASWVAIALEAKGVLPYSISGGIVWFGLYLSLGIRLVTQNQFLVIERFGQYYRTARAGIRVLCLPGLVDRLAPHGGGYDHYWHRSDLYEAENKIDFTDASAGLKAQIWWRVKKEDKDKDAPQKWAYSVENTEARIKEIIDGTLRVLLQGQSLDEASKNLIEITRKVMADPGVIKALDEMGVELDPNKGVVITDIVLSESIIAAREEALRGVREASKQGAQGLGYIRAILAIQEDAARGRLNDPSDPSKGYLVKPKKLSFEAAKGIYENQRALEVLQAKPGNVNFVSPDVNGAIISLGLDNDGKK